MIEASGALRKNSAANANPADTTCPSSVNDTRSSSGSPRSTNASAVSSLPGKEALNPAGASTSAEPVSQVKEAED